MSDNGKINVCYGIFDKNGTYAKVAGTSACSVFENTRQPVVVHIIHDSTLTERNRRNFQEMADSYGQEIFFYDVSTRWHYVWERFRKALPQWVESRCTIGMFFRLVIGDILPKAERAIYLDCDTVVNMDIGELWECEAPESGIAAVADSFVQKHGTRVINNSLVMRSEYFNSGVLAIDLKKVTKVRNLADKVLNFVLSHECEYPDQDALNYLFPHSAVLPAQYNTFVNEAREGGQPIKACIYHYANNAFGMNMEDEFNALYFKFFTKTPWCDEIFIGNLVKSMNLAKMEMLILANLCAGKRRIIIGLASEEKSVAEIFDITARDIYIPLEGIRDFNLVFDIESDIILAFLNERDYEAVKRKLLSLGLTENVHFLNAAKQIGVADSRTDDYRFFLDS